MTELLSWRHLSLVPLLTICAATWAYGQRWGDFKKDTCTKPGYRQYSAILWDVPFGGSWEKACASQSATINGQNFSHPDRCKNTGTNEWGEFDVPDSSCQAHWSIPQKGACVANGKRTYSAQILDVPPSQSWENACGSTPETVLGHTFSTPSQCRNVGLAGEWGDFYMPDDTCEVHLVPSQWPNPNPDANKPIWGFADTHNHQFAYLGFGGKFVAGEVFDSGSDGIKTALQWCDCFGTHGVPLCLPKAPNVVHGPGGAEDLVGSAMTKAMQVTGALDVGHKVGGYPQFDGWPVWNSVTHQQGYYQWLKRAHAGGLQLMVMQAVNSEYLCSKVDTVPGFGCDDMAAADRQLDAAKKLEAYVDKYDGGWYRIVYNSAEARQAIHKGQLAVVLGIEVDDLFHCGREANLCSNDDRGKQYVTQQLQKYYDAGVRHIFPIHGTDNAFGGPAIFEGIYLAANVQMNNKLFDPRDCSSPDPRLDVEYTLHDDYSSLLAIGEVSFPLPSIPKPVNGVCNNLGLTPMGEFLIEEMMKRHMIIDIDHMSWKAVGDPSIEHTVMAIAKHHDDYPVISSHSGYLEMSTGKKKSEGQKTRQQLQNLWMAGVITAQGPTDGADGSHGVPQWGSKVKNDCSNSSKTFAQAYLYAVDVMGGPSKAHVALATDMMGGIYQPGPRFGPNACYSKNGFVDPKSARQREIDAQKPTPQVPDHFILPHIMTVPLWKSRACDGRDFNPSTTDCTRTFDFNVDGLAHVGMLPDLIQDLYNVGLTDNDLNPLFRSAEAYIEMWERAEKLQ